MSQKTAASGLNRNAWRFRAGIPAVLEIGGTDFECEAHNLSRSGVLLIGQLPLAKGNLGVTISSAAGDRSLRIQGTVRRMAPGEDGDLTQIGLEFDVLDTQTKEQLDLMISRVIEGKVPAPIEALPDNPSPQKIREALGKVALAHRMNLASRGSIKEREILMHDPNIRVIQAICRNPTLTPPEAWTIVRKRPLMPTTLEILARDPRMKSNSKFMFEIAAHPSAPFSLVERLVSAMPRQQQEEIIKKPGLNPGVRQNLARKFSRGSRR